jgi:hypothetical protein
MTTGRGAGGVLGEVVVKAEQGQQSGVKYLQGNILLVCNFTANHGLVLVANFFKLILDQGKSIPASRIEHSFAKNQRAMLIGVAV